ncbi:hypothetical protein AB1Y20_013170 [Prymnesium parvum]|uniref:alpha-1,2-Mannosidase n=1 Tax=Prymnesium parvum TaxID=97485 RepID=A0AB34IJW4_PRYPA
MRRSALATVALALLSHAAPTCDDPSLPSAPPSPPPPLLAAKLRSLWKRWRGPPPAHSPTAAAHRSAVRLPPSSPHPSASPPSAPAAASAAPLSSPPLPSPPRPAPPTRRPPPEVAAAEPERQRMVRDAFVHAIGGYTAHAWGLDELDPINRVGVASYGMGLTIIDSLDAMVLMGLRDDFERALGWVEHALTFGEQEGINVFEVTIRVLGGLLSAYELSAEPILLRRAEEIAAQLLFAFKTPTGIPYGTVSLNKGVRFNPAWAAGASTIAEVATLQLEFRALSRHTGDPVYEAAAQRIMKHLRNMPWPEQLPRGLYPTFISPELGEFVNADVTLGARADSLYEYLLKQWLFSGRTDERVRAMYDDSIKAIRKYLVRRGNDEVCENCTFVGMWNYRTDRFQPQMDHLACFMPGVLALGAEGETAAEELQLAEDLMRTCYRMYAEQPSGLAPEICVFQSKGVPASAQAKHSLLRPETVESLFILWRVTGKQRYRDWGWDVFLAIERGCKISTGGYSGVLDVTRPAHELQYNGRMESFFTAETLKYLWLLFGDGTDIPLDQYVLNTEAHPLLIHEDYQWGSRWGSLPDLTQLLHRPENESMADLRVRAEMLRYYDERLASLEQRGLID